MASSSAEAELLGYGGSGYYSPAVACPVDYATAGGIVTITGEGDGDYDDRTDGSRRPCRPGPKAAAPPPPSRMACPGTPKSAWALASP